MWLKLLSIVVLVGILTNAKAWQVTKESEYVDRHNNIGAEILKNLNSKNYPDSDNVVIPASVESVLLMLQLGADRNTAEKMADKLFLEGNSKANIAAQLLNNDSQLHKADHSTRYEFESSNLVMIKRSLPVKPSFERHIHKARVEIHRRDQIGNSASIKQVNELVTEKTRGKIAQLLVEELPVNQTEMIMLNTVYLKSNWQHPFDSDKTKTASFNNNGSFQYMENRNYYPYNLDPTMTELPYADDDLGFCLMLPYQGPPKQYGRMRSPSEWVESNPSSIEFDYSIELKEANLKMPRFTITRRHDLKNALENLNFLFEKDANLGDITGSAILEVNQMTHVATIEVNEEGIQVAAATYVTLVARPSSDKPLELDLSQPFAFFLRFHPTGQNLVIGKVDRLNGTVN